MYDRHCCRTCLSNDSLSSIFLIPEKSAIYSDIIYSTAGVKVELNDSLPQEMCEDCIKIINTCSRFRKTCETAHQILLEKYNNADFFIVKHDSSSKATGKAFIDIQLDYNTSVLSKNDKLSQKSNYDVELSKSEDHEYIPEDSFEQKLVIVESEPLKVSRRNKKTNTYKDQIPLRKSKKKETAANSDKYKIDKNNWIECKHCNKVLTSKLSLRNHYKIHTGFDVVCEHCGKKFITRRLLLMHCRAKHGYEKTDKCSFCDYRASNAEQVKIHERLHTGERPYVCKDCGAGFHRQSSYLQHVAIHLPEKTVQCDQCPARFKSVTLMNIHKNRHKQPQYRFKCYICNTDFARRRNVIRHLQRIHAVPPEDMQDIPKVKKA